MYQFSLYETRLNNFALFPSEFELYIFPHNSWEFTYKMPEKYSEK